MCNRSLNDWDIQEFLLAVLSTVGFVFLSQFANIFLSLLFSLLSVNSFIVSLLGLIISMLIPFLIYRRFKLPLTFWNNFPLLCSLLISMYLVLVDDMDFKLVIFTYTIAVSEEFFFRGFIQEFLEKRMQYLLAILLQSLLFAFINHSSAPFMENLLYRFPAGLMLSVVCRKFGLPSSITIHYFNNLFA